MLPEHIEELPGIKNLLNNEQKDRYSEFLPDMFTYSCMLFIDRVLENFPKDSLEKLAPEDIMNVFRSSREYEDILNELQKLDE